MKKTYRTAASGLSRSGPARPSEPRSSGCVAYPDVRDGAALIIDNRDVVGILISRDRFGYPGRRQPSAAASETAQPSSRRSSGYKAETFVGLCP